MLFAFYLEPHSKTVLQYEQNGYKNWRCACLASRLQLLSFQHLQIHRHLSPQLIADLNRGRPRYPINRQSQWFPNRC